MLLTRLLRAILIVCFVFLGDAAVAQEESSWRLVSWASPSGNRSLQYGTLHGLKAMVSFINANGGVNGQALTLVSLEKDDSSDGFFGDLEALTFKVKPHAAVGGSADLLAGKTSDYFRRIGRPWFGPWTDDPDIYAGSQSDPAGLLPSAPIEFELIFRYVRKYAPLGRDVYLIQSSGPKSSHTGILASEIALRHGFKIKVATLPSEFRNWGELSTLLPNAGTIILWTPPGPSAAIKRVLSKTMAPDVLWLTSSLNPPCREIISVSGGSWEGMVFPSILSPSKEIPEAHRAVLEKYSPPGLKSDYPAFMGFAQGQLLVKALAKVGRIGPEAPLEILKTLKETNLSGGVIAGERLPQGPGDPGGAYLAISDRNGGWDRAEKDPPLATN
jgi:hypothetical protein